MTFVIVNLVYYTFEVYAQNRMLVSWLCSGKRSVVVFIVEFALSFEVKIWSRTDKQDCYVSDLFLSL